MHRAGLRGLFFVVLLVGAIGPVAAGVGAPQESEPPRAELSPERAATTQHSPSLRGGMGMTLRSGVTERRTYRNPPGQPGSIVVTLAYELSGGVDSLSVEIPAVREGQAERIDSTGFERRGQGTYHASGAESPTLTFRVAVSSTRFGPTVGALNGSKAVDRGPWALVSVGDALATAVTTDPRVPVHRQATVDGAGIVRQGLAFIGPYQTHTRTVGDRTYTLIVPERAPLVSSPAMVLDSIANTSRDFDVGSQHSESVFFAIPVAGVATTANGVAHSAGDTPRVWVRADLGIAGNRAGTWTHEYVHTRQAYTPKRTLHWTIEASATYYGTLLPLQQGRISYERFRAAFADQGYGDATLAKPESWNSVMVPYEKGAHVLAALDVRIRNATNGQATLEDVFRRLNQQPEPVSYAEFRTVVAEVASPAVAQWLDPFVLQKKSLPPLPETAFQFVGGPDRDPDGDGLRNAAEHERGTHPFQSDTDGDGLDDAREVKGPTNASRSDTDRDGLIDGAEYDHPTSDPMAADTDNDSLNDSAELTYQTNLRQADTDGDGLSDGREVELGADPHWTDTDRDGLADAREVALGTALVSVDTDGDGLLDPRETTLATDPTASDTDGDGYGDAVEIRLGTSPTASTAALTYWRMYIESVLASVTE